MPSKPLVVLSTGRRRSRSRWIEAAFWIAAVDAALYLIVAGTFGLWPW